MELIDLVLTVCLLSNPEQCRVEHLHFESRGSLAQCMFLAPPEIAKWSAEHPSLKVIRWKCEYPGREQEI
jgi:hypothetical protein